MEQLLIHDDELNNQMIGLNYRSTMKIEFKAHYHLGTSELIEVQRIVASTLPTKGTFLCFITSSSGTVDANNPGYIKLYLYEGKIYEDKMIGPSANDGCLTVYSN
jgi:long-subunit fatty acid transport protein